MEKVKCSICGNEVEKKETHNAYPLKKQGERCCSTCNYGVILARMNVVNSKIIRKEI